MRVARRRWPITAVTVVATAVAMSGVLSAEAGAKAPSLEYSALPSTSQAGGHPDVQVYFKIKHRLAQQSQSPCNCEDIKDAVVHLPTGFIGNPSATPQCTIADFSADACAIDSQIGIVEVNAPTGPPFVAAIYNVVPPPEVAGLVAFKLFLFGAPQFTILAGRTESDYGLDATATSIYHGGGLPLESFRQVLWGVPADKKHDPLRLDSRFNPNGVGQMAYLGQLCDADGSLSTNDPNTVVQPCGDNPLPPTASNSPLTPFLQNPTTCDEPLETSFESISYDGEIDIAHAFWPQGTGCNQLGFNPSLYAQPTIDQSDSPSGVDVNLTVPQPLSPTIPSPSQLKAAKVTLPPGFSINPNAADGKVACTDEQANFGTRRAAQCPEFAKVGSLEIHSSALPGPLPGWAYIGEPLPGNRYRVFLVADAFATHVKLPGTISPDPATGQLTISFENLPQSPLTAFNMHFFGSERGTLATPTQCGTYPVISTFTPWNSRQAAQTSTQFFTVDTGPGGNPCPGGPRPFSPRMQAASAENTAGSRTPFAVDFARDDGNQNLFGLTVITPPGFTASLRGVAYCPESAIAQLGNALYSGVAELSAPACPAASQIGTATAAAGAGSRPLHVPGKVFLAGPYKGEPMSLVVVIPGVSGPYDLGNVVTRAAINVDPLTAQVTTTSDPLPQIIEGIPLRTRSIRVILDRPAFTINPTNCDMSAVGAVISGNEGGVSRLADPYQVANCASLPFRPKLTLRASGGLKRRGHPAIRAVIQAKPGDANLRRVSVTLPKGGLLDNSHIGTVCVNADFAAGTCPEKSRLGRAEVITPLLDTPLRGMVYMRASRNRLPDMGLDLDGQFDIESVGRIDSVKGRLRTTFETIPDVPVTKIVVELAGGSKGLVINTEDLCDSRRRATVRLTGQNGATTRSRPRYQAACGSKQSRKRKIHRTKGRR